MRDDTNRDDEALDERNERDLASTGDKRSWERTVARVPSDGDDDPKTNEPRKGDLSLRDGDRADTASRTKDDREG